MSPEVQNRINEVKFECAGDAATLKKVNGIETALRWAQRGVFARGIRYALFFIISVILMLIVHSDVEKNFLKLTFPEAYPTPVHQTPWMIIYDYDEKRNSEIEATVSRKRTLIAIIYFFGPGLTALFLWELFIAFPRRKQLAKLGEQGFLRHYARSNGLPENLFEVKRG
jgi:hypothetical protein